MAALTSPKDIEGRCEPMGFNAAYVFADGYTTYKGAAVMGVNGKARPVVSNVAGSVMLGVFSEYPADRITASGADVVVTDGVRLQLGRFVFEVSSIDPVDTPQIGSTVYFEDDQTVKKTDAGDDVGGILRDLWLSGGALKALIELR
jgi:hypothetical protein